MIPTSDWLRSLSLIVVMALSSTTFAHEKQTSAHSNETAIGKPGVSNKATRTVTVTMTDNMRYTPNHISVKQGETIRFTIINKGQVKHELNLGTPHELLEHLELMKKFPDMIHDEPNKITLFPGQKGEIIWQFTKAGTVNFACLIPGHYEAGMRGEVKVSNKALAQPD